MEKLQQVNFRKIISYRNVLLPWLQLFVLFETYKIFSYKLPLLHHPFCSVTPLRPLPPAPPPTELFQNHPADGFIM